MKKLALIVVGLALVAASCNKQSQVTPTPTPTPTPQPTANIYENNYMKVALADGWTAKQAGTNQAAVNITKGDYILYINSQATQASGVEGGRFAEIAQGAPSADAVVTVQPSNPCGSSSKTDNLSVDGDSSFSRVDLYVAAGDKKDWCAVPTNGKTVWYFSYITDANKGYFNYYTPGQGKALVVTMAYNSKVVNNFPVKGSDELNTALAEMTTMVNSLQIKQK